MPTRPFLAVVCLLTAYPVLADELFVRVGPDGAVFVTDQASDQRFAVYTPGTDFEAWAMQQKAVPHRGRSTAHLSATLPRGRLAIGDDHPSCAFDQEIAAAAEKHQVPARLIWAVIAVESGFRPNVRSRVGAQGLMQLMPATANDLGVVDAFDPAQNIDGGTRYLAGLLRTFPDESLAIAAYNAGPGRVKRLGRIPRIPETQAYVKKVSQLAGLVGQTDR